MNMLKKYLKFCYTFEGRLNRKTFVFNFLGLYLLIFICGIFAFVFVPFYNKSTDYSRIVFLAVMIGVFIFGILPVITGIISIQVRRLHDLNVSGKWLLLIFPLLGAGNVIIDKGINLQLSHSFVLGVTAMNVILTLLFLIWLIFIKGTVGDNKYGPDPLVSS